MRPAKGATIRAAPVTSMRMPVPMAEKPSTDCSHVVRKKISASTEADRVNAATEEPTKVGLPNRPRSNIGNLRRSSIGMKANSTIAVA